MTDRSAQAETMLAAGQADAVISLLCQDGPPADAATCVLLARAYALRNDSRGDHYAAAWFAKRAQELGSTDPRLAEFARRYAELSAWQHAAPRNPPKLKRRPFKAVSAKIGVCAEPKDFDWLAKNIPCQNACPAGTDIPGYLTAIFNGEFDKAYRINLEANVFPGVLGRVCARPCEGKCRHGWPGLGEPVAICHSKRAAADHRGLRNVLLDKWFPASGKTVAVVGAGPAGLAAARELARLGHAVTVFEKHALPGGMMVQGIPEFRLPREDVAAEIAQAAALGITLRCGVAIGRDVTLGRLLAQHDAVVVAAGTLKPNLLDLPGRELAGIRHGLDFLLEVNTAGTATIGPKVVVIGGGFTAMDCARTARRLVAPPGAQLETRDTKPAAVAVFYRRSQAEMLITPGELEELEHEGIPMSFMVAPKAYHGKDGRLTQVEFVRTELGETDAGGRRRPVEIPGSNFRIEADTVLLATGQFPDTGWVDATLREALTHCGDWKLAPDGFTAAANPKLFVAGDAATGAASLIQAIGHAKKCVRTADFFLTAHTRLKDAVIVENAADTGRIREMDAVPLQPMPALPAAERTITAEVETGLSQDQAPEETQRCYRCHFKYEIDTGKCIYCDWCIKAKPRPECIIRVKSFQYDTEGRITGWVKAEKTDDTSVVWINQEECIRCGACQKACPVDAISLQKVSRACTACNLGGETE